MAKNQKIEELLGRGVEEVIDKNHLQKRLLSEEKLRIKFGIDPTAPDIHLGQSAILWKLRDFQELGHQIILIIGDFTARIGDPTDKLAPRRPLSIKEVKANMKTYERQVSKILDLKKTKIVYNSKFLSGMSFEELFRLSHLFTVDQMLERDMFQKRRASQKPIWLHEFFYPVLQAYDSVNVKADVEIGGSDQLFNMLAGRNIQPHFKQEPQDVVTMKLLVGLDGKQKMSKSLGNYVGIEESPEDQYGKIMSIPDGPMGDYFELATRLSLIEIIEIKNNLEQHKINPRDVKARLAREIVSLYHGAVAVKAAEGEFNRIFKEGMVPSKIPKVQLAEKSLGILDLLTKMKLAPSKSEAKRLVEQGGVKIEQEEIKDWRDIIEIKKGQVVRVGKRKFAKIG
ncbi:MAG: tyrosine--tRNA ligase [Candidatus Nealsonbacteria bacterium]|nr:tyrosine--tRNA ligase [Candidatus Nealsonbacteria bacterium]